MMRVLHVPGIFSPIGGGSQVAVLSWVKNLHTLGIPVKVIMNQSYAHGITDPHLKACIIAVPDLDIGRMYRGYSIIPYLSQAVLTEIKAFAPTVINFHEPQPSAFTIMKWAHQNQLKTTVFYHTNFGLSRAATNSLFEKVILWLVEQLQLSLLRQAGHIQVPTQTTLAGLAAPFQDKSVVVPYPIEQNFFLSGKELQAKASLQTLAKSQPLRLITVSRLTPEKNIAVLLRAVKLVGSQVELSIVGDGVAYQSLHDEVRRLSLQNQVRFCGWVSRSDLPAVLLQHDMFVSASGFETFGLVYREAVGLGLPCIVLDYPVSREVLPHGAVFVPSLNPSEWAEALTELVQTPHTLLSLRKDIVEHYDTYLANREDRATQQLVTVYRQIEAM